VIQLRGSSLDLLEVLLGGLCAPATGFCLPGRKPSHWPVEPTLQVPSATARAALGRGGLLLADPDGTPLARLAVDAAGGEPGQLVHLAGALTPLQPAEHPPFRRLRLTSPLAVPGEPGGAPGGTPLVVAAFSAEPVPAQLARALVSARSGRLVLLAVLEGAASPGDAAGLVEALESAAAEVPGAAVRLLVVPTAEAGAPARAGDRSALHGILLDRLGADTLLDFSAAPPAVPAAGAEDAAGPPGRGPAPGRPRGVVVLFTGLSGSGKSTLARELAERLRGEDDRHTVLLDGDDVRTLLSSGLGFSRADRELNVRRIGWVASLVADAGGIALCAPIAPFDSSRREVRAMAAARSGFLLVHVSTPLDVCEGRDRKGLYAKARAGLIPDFTGISSPYEDPGDADVVLDMAQTGVADGVGQLLAAVRRLR
jgi:sulfate adenylyltransferase